MLRKIRNFQSFPIICIFDSMFLTSLIDLLVVLWLPLCLTRLSRTEPGSLLTSIGIQATFIGDGQNEESVTRKKGVEGGLFHAVLGTMDVSLR